MPNANRVFVAKEQLSLDVIKQYRVDVTSTEEKDLVLQEYILKNADRLGQTIIFVASRRTAQALYEVRCSETAGPFKLCTYPCSRHMPCHIMPVVCHACLSTKLS